MIEVTTHYAKTHLSRLLREIQRGETVVILSGKTPVARLTAVESPEATPRPQVGEPSTSGVTWTDDAFAPLTGAELREWGL